MPCMNCLKVHEAGNSLGAAPRDPILYQFCGSQDDSHLKSCQMYLSNHLAGEDTRDLRDMDGPLDDFWVVQIGLRICLEVWARVLDT